MNPNDEAALHVMRQRIAAQRDYNRLDQEYRSCRLRTPTRQHN